MRDQGDEESGGDGQAAEVGALTGTVRPSAFGLLVAIGGIAVVACVATLALYARDMRHAYARIEGRSTVIASPHGDIEYATGGTGTPVLVVHGSGGGFDQAELIAQAVPGDACRWIAPSRFGYLRSTLRSGATFDDQAHAFAFLLDHLGVDRVAVVALSHGGPSALLFAVLYPHRVTSLTLLSAGVASSDDADQQQSSRQGDALTAIFRGDFRYWLMVTALRPWFVRLMGADAGVLASMDATQRELVDRIIDFMHPVSLRTTGVVFDNRAAMPGERIRAIRAPTLVFHAADDTLQRFRNAEFAAEHIAGARLVRFERGGHLVVAVEQARIREMTLDHIRRHGQ